MKTVHDCISRTTLLFKVRKFGWYVIMVEATDYLPSFAYTIGLWKNYKHPEIISFGLTTNTLHLILNQAGELIKSGQQFTTNQYYDFFFQNNSKTQFLSVDQQNIPDYFGQAIKYYAQNEFPAIQLVWTDRNNHFPWENEFEEAFKYRQPLLDRNTDFKFMEAKNLGIFTTRQWLESEMPILHVIHDYDGDWQFLTGNQTPEDGKLVALEQIVTKDKTLNEVFNLDYGNQAVRKFIGDAWIRSVLKDNVEE